MKHIYIGLLVGLFGSFLLFHGIPLGHPGDVLWGGDFDPKFIRWTVEWGYHAFFQKHFLLGVWNANTGYPHSNSLAFSDSILGIQIFYSPLRFLGFSQLGALYSSLAGFCILGSVLTQIALNRISEFSTFEKLVIIFCAQFSPFMTNFFYHYQLVGFELAPSFFLFLFLFLRNTKTFDLMLTVVTYCLAVFFSTYLGPMLLSVAILLVVSFLISERPPSVKEFLKSRIKPPGIAWLGVIACAAFLFVFQIMPYMKQMKQMPLQSYDDSQVCSAHWNTLFTGKSALSYFYKNISGVWGFWESAYFPGYLLVGVIVIFLILFFAHFSKRNSLSFGWKSSSLISCMVVVFLASYFLSLGPYMEWPSRVRILFYWFSKIIPGLRSVRAPGRFGMFMGLPVGIFFIMLLRELRKKISAPHVLTGTTICLVLIMVLESLPDYPVVPAHEVKKEVHLAVASQLNDSTPLIELPIAGATYIDTIANVMNQLVGSTYYWSPLVATYAPVPTPEFSELVRLDTGISSGKEDVGSIISFGEKIAVRHFLIHLDLYSEGARKRWEGYIGSLMPAQILVHHDNSYLFKID
jgi:hypothetical protein